MSIFKDISIDYILRINKDYKKSKTRKLRVMYPIELTFVNYPNYIQSAPELE